MTADEPGAQRPSFHGAPEYCPAGRRLALTLLLAPLCFGACAGPVASGTAPWPGATPSVVALTASAPSPGALEAARVATPRAGASGCLATQSQGLGPNYEPGAPERTAVGTGYALDGVVLAEGGCAPIAGALVEIWLAGPQGAYGPDWRASLHTDEHGRFHFESHRPAGGPGQSPHLHVRLSAEGFRELALIHVPEPGQTKGELAAVLAAK